MNLIRKMNKISEFLTKSNDKRETKRLVNMLQPHFKFPLPVLGSFPKRNKHRTKQRCEKDFFPLNKKSAPRKSYLDSPSLLEQLILVCKCSSVEKEAWCELLACDPVQVYDRVASMSAREKQKFLEQMEEAQNFWACHHCKGYSLDDIYSNYVVCDQCQLWFHQSCANYSPIVENVQVAAWFCLNCRQ